jgi:2,3-bisphosphoglycerate-dependent phosphoglycerate mutase
VSIDQGGLPDDLAPTLHWMERAFLLAGERAELILVRHAQQIRTLEEAYRSGGPQLSETGRTQARLTGEYIAAETHLAPIGALYSSDLNRTVETAGIIGEVLGLGAPRPVTALREIDVLGRDAGAPGLELAEQEDAARAFALTRRWDAFPDTEPGGALRHRIVSALAEIAARHPAQRVVVVSHAGAIAAAVAHLLNADPDMTFFAGHAAVSRLFHGEDRFVIHSLNEVGHLRSRDLRTY